jgi:2-polyprenyl-6-methoxyphenol hydroxylase-like FAD-dependent oxidoreductase
MRDAPDLYFDSVKQIRMDHWSRGRVALVGDAAFCPSLLAGEGTSLAIAAAYILAGELKHANGDYSAAFAAYEARLKKLIEEKQDAATWLGGWFAPKTPFGIYARNLLTRLFNNRLVGGIMVERMLGHGMALPNY